MQGCTKERGGIRNTWTAEVEEAVCNIRIGMVLSNTYHDLISLIMLIRLTQVPEPRLQVFLDAGCVTQQYDTLLALHVLAGLVERVVLRSLGVLGKVLKGSGMLLSQPDKHIVDFLCYHYKIRWSCLSIFGNESLLREG